LTLAELIQKLNLRIEAGADNVERPVTGGYVSDLLSDVIAGATEGDLWITLQVHQNIVAVAFLNNLAGICLVGGRSPDPDTIEKADEQGVPILVSDLPAYQLAGRLYEMGIGKT
jgi:predicted transcriptional regulator